MNSLSRICIITKYHLISNWNWITGYLSRFIELPAYLILLGGGLTSLVHLHNFNYLQFMMYGLLVLASFRNFVSAMIDIANDRKWGTMAIFMNRGGRYEEYLLSIYLVELIMIIIQAVSTLILAKIIFPQSIYFGLTLLGLLKVIIVFLGWVGIAAAIGARVQAYTTRDLIVSLITLPVTLSAPILYPLHNVPKFLSIIAHCNPLTYQVEWVRSSSFLYDLPLMLVWDVFGVCLGLYFLRRSPTLSREG